MKAWLMMGVGMLLGAVLMLGAQRVGWVSMRGPGEHGTVEAQVGGPAQGSSNRMQARGPQDPIGLHQADEGGVSPQVADLRRRMGESSPAPKSKALSEREGAGSGTYSQVAREAAPPLEPSTQKPMRDMPQATPSSSETRIGHGPAPQAEMRVVENPEQQALREIAQIIQIGGELTLSGIGGTMTATVSPRTGVRVIGGTAVEFVARYRRMEQLGVR